MELIILFYVIDKSMYMYVVIIYLLTQGPLVYVNYGRISDFQYLVYNLSLNLTGHVCIARYGKIFRGDKVSSIIHT